jgi:hypothetical protein
MTLYNVHIYREMRLYFPAIEAATPEEAARIAGNKLTKDAEYTEDCDGDNLTALVDLVGDDGFEQSVTIDFEPERLRKAALELLAVLSRFLSYLDDPIISNGRLVLPVEALANARAAIAKATTGTSERRPA